MNHQLEEEMKRISQDLHREAGKILAEATREIDLASASNSAESKSRLASVRRLLDETGNRLRHFSHELRPTILDDLGLVPALQFLAEGVKRRTGVSVRVLGEMDQRIAANAELTVYRVVQEAINNALRHGGELLTITIRVQIRDGLLRCAIADDGVGFDVDEVLENRGRSSLGLLCMRERVAAIGGELDVISSQGSGTIIQLTLPIRAC